MDLELVEDAGREGQLCDAGAVDQRVLVARGRPGLGHRGPDVGHAPETDAQVARTEVQCYSSC